MRHVPSLAVAAVVAALLTAPAAHAQGTKPAAPRGKPARPAAAEPAADPETSEGARAGHTWLAALRAGNFLGGILGAGLEGSFMHKPELQFGLLVMTGKTDLRDEVKADPVLDLKDFTAQGDIVQLQARYFVANSFYVTAGLGVRRVGFSMRIEDRVGSGSIDTTAAATSAILALNVGNAWAWSNGFFIGADWIGYSVPFTSTYKSSVKTEGSATEAVNELNDIIQDTSKELGSTGSTQFLVLNVGFML